MNIQELIEKYKKYEDGLFDIGAKVACQNFLKDLEQLDKPEYEVEKEKRYVVKIKGVNEECECLVFGELSNTWKLRSIGSFGELKKHHTRKELEESGFGWVFDCEGIEIEEVE